MSTPSPPLPPYTTNLLLSLAASLTKIKTLLPRKFKHLTNNCNETIDQIQAHTEEKEREGVSSLVTTLTAVCTAKSPKITAIALSCFTILTTNTLITGSTMDTLPSPVITMITTICGTADLSDDKVHVTLTHALVSCVTSPTVSVHEAALLSCVRAAFHVFLVSKSEEVRARTKEGLEVMLGSVLRRMEEEDRGGKDDGAPSTPTKSPRPDQGSPEVAVTPDRYADTSTANGSNTLCAPNTPGGKDSAPKGETILFKSQFHKDAFLVFRALCKLSSKVIADESAISAGSSFLPSQSTVDPLALHSKALSLELLLLMLDQCGPAFCEGDKFVYAVRHYLCVSLLKNCMSTNTSVVYLSLRIFRCLVRKFRGVLKHEIEVFVANIFLRVLESVNSSHEQKCLVLEALSDLCQDPITLSQIFLNYDCDMNAVDLFKSIVNNLARVAKGSRNLESDSSESKGYALSQFISGKSSSAKTKASQDAALRTAALEVLVLILRSMLRAQDLPGSHDELTTTVPTTKLQLTTRPPTPPTPLPAPPEDDLPLSSSSAPAASPADAPPTPPDSSSDTSSRSRSNSHVMDPATSNSIVTSFNQKRAVQEDFETGLVKFKLNMKTGILYFAKCGFIPALTSSHVAKFVLDNKERLDKTQIGEVLGKEPEYAFVKDEPSATSGGKGFCVEILHEYVTLLEFAGMEFDNAIRHFLSGFRLPGEAQKIDRIMEKFAASFVSQNDTVFPSADTAFILAFSIIMLNTDLHNPSIKEDRRMTREGFTRNNRGIGKDGGDLPPELLEGIFDRIQKSAFSLKEDDDARLLISNPLSKDSGVNFEGLFGNNKEQKKKQEEFRKERAELMSSSEQLMKLAVKKKQKEQKLSSVEVSEGPALDPSSLSPAEATAPMFDVAWGPMIGSLSQILEITDDPNSIRLCLRGFVYAVRIAACNEMYVARDTFVNSLAKFTTLGSLKEMRQKNIECIRALLGIATTDGERLAESWAPVLQCISQLAKLQLYANGLATDDELFVGEEFEDGVRGSESRDSRGGSISMFNNRESGAGSRLSKKKLEAKLVEELNGRAVLEQVEEELIDKVFANSVLLSVSGIEHFIMQLVQVSAAEVHGGAGGGSQQALTSPQACPIAVEGGARIFALQRLVEVADFNMNERPRIVWTRIWEQMARHFAVVGCHSNSMVSMYAIDSLRQLSSKFLEKPELKDFNFQRVFLRPFLVIMESANSREDVRELILRCVDNLIRALAKNIRSGWKTIFGILSLSARDSKVGIAKLGLEILHRLFDEHLDQLCTSVEDFVGLCRTSLSFVCGGGGGGERHIRRKSNDYEEYGRSLEDRPAFCLPEGLSIRALCCVACCADAIVDGRIVSAGNDHAHQSEDCSGTGGFYTYRGLDEADAEAMVLWRPIFDGLAYGSVNAGGDSLVVQRACVCTLRAIVLRHGSIFNTAQLKAVMEQSFETAWSEGCRGDDGEVAGLFSESPLDKSCESVLRAPPRLPVPAAGDKELLKMAQLSQSEGTSCAREMGVAECLVEAMLLNLRRGGPGDAVLVERVEAGKMGEEEEEEVIDFYAESWIANTAPSAFSLVVDMCANLFSEQEVEEMLPIVVRILTSSEFFLDKGAERGERWHASEALLRAGIQELLRVPERAGWWEGCVRWLSFIVKKVVAQAQHLVVKILEKEEEERIVGARANALDDIRKVDTAYGAGEIVREEEGGACVVKLEWGAVLYANDGVVKSDVRWNALSDDEGDEEGGLDESLESIRGVGGVVWGGALCGRLGVLSALVEGIGGLKEGIVREGGEEEWKSVLEGLKVVREFNTHREKGSVGSLGGGRRWARWVEGEAVSGGEGLGIEVREAAGRVEVEMLALCMDGGWGEEELVQFVKARLRDYLDVEGMGGEKGGKGGKWKEWTQQCSKAGVLACLAAVERWGPEGRERLVGRGELWGILCDLVQVEARELRVELGKVLKGC